MSAILQPWIFALTGVSLAVISVILGGYLVSVRQKQKQKAQDGLIEATFEI